MDKPIMTQYDTVYAWLAELIAYEERQIERLKSWDKSRIISSVKGIIDGKTYHDNHRVVFVITNSIGQRAYADTSRDAMLIAREAINQPCKITVCPIMPVWTHHDTPLDMLKKLIEDTLNDN